MACIGRQRFPTETPLDDPVRGTSRLRPTFPVLDQHPFSANRHSTTPDEPTTRANTPDALCTTTNSFSKISRLGHEPLTRGPNPGTDDRQVAVPSHTDTDTPTSISLAAAEGQPSSSLGSPELPGLNPPDSESSDRPATRVDRAAAVEPVDASGSSPVHSYDVPVDTPRSVSLRHERAMLVAHRQPPQHTSIDALGAGRRLPYQGGISFRPLPVSRYVDIQLGCYGRGGALDVCEVEVEEEDDDPDSEDDSPASLSDVVGPLSLSPSPLSPSEESVHSTTTAKSVTDRQPEPGSSSFTSHESREPTPCSDTRSDLSSTSPPTSSPSNHSPTSPKESFIEKRKRLQTRAPENNSPEEKDASPTPFSQVGQLRTRTRRIGPGDLAEWLFGLSDTDPTAALQAARALPSPLRYLAEELLKARASTSPGETQAVAQASRGSAVRFDSSPETLCSPVSVIEYGPRPNFDEAELEQPAEPRNRKACVRCRFQKQKCLQDDSDPDGPCLPCKSFSKTSRKTIHRTPCFRKKISDVVLHRRGGLGLTKRWEGVEMKNIRDAIPRGGVRTISFTSEVCEVPIVVKVVRFKPRRGDITKRYWTTVQDDELVYEGKELAHYCLADIHTAASDFEEYLNNNCARAFVAHACHDFTPEDAPEERSPALDSDGDFIMDGVTVSDDTSEEETFPSKSLKSDESVPGLETDIIAKSHRVAYMHFWNLPDKASEEDDSHMVPNKEKEMLRALFKLWFANRHTRGSSYICSSDTLGMVPAEEPGYPLPGKVSLPRMILAQFDSITYSKGLNIHGGIFIREMETLMSRNHKKYWFTTYISLFVLLSEASWLTRDRYRHARQLYGRAVRYSIPSFVEELQEGCNIMLMHWHYYSCRPYPDPNKPQEEQKSFLADLTPMQYSLVMDTIQRPEIQRHLEIFRNERGSNGKVASPESPKETYSARDYCGSQHTMDWDDPYYWVSQMFEEGWRPHRTYMREKVPRRVPSTDFKRDDEDEDVEVNEDGEEEEYEDDIEGEEIDYGDIVEEEDECDYDAEDDPEDAANVDGGNGIEERNDESNDGTKESGNEEENDTEKEGMEIDEVETAIRGEAESTEEAADEQDALRETVWEADDEDGCDDISMPEEDNYSASEEDEVTDTERTEVSPNSDKSSDSANTSSTSGSTARIASSNPFPKRNRARADHLPKAQSEPGFGLLPLSEGDE